MIESITKWEELTPYLDLDEVEVEDIKETRSSPQLRRIEYLLSGSKRMERKLLTEPWPRYLLMLVAETWLSVYVK